MAKGLENVFTLSVTKLGNYRNARHIRTGAIKGFDFN